MAVRAADLRRNIKELGFERGVVTTVELLLEELVGFRQALNEMAKLQNMMIDTLNNTVTGVNAMSNEMLKVKRKVDGGLKEDEH